MGTTQTAQFANGCTVATGCISKCIAVYDADQLETDLCNASLLGQYGDDLQAEVRPIVGQRARIVRGPLKELELTGPITEVKSQRRLTIMVKFLQQDTSISIDEADIELLQGTSPTISE